MGVMRQLRVRDIIELLYENVFKLKHLQQKEILMVHFTNRWIGASIRSNGKESVDLITTFYGRNRGDYPKGGAVLKRAEFVKNVHRSANETKGGKSSLVIEGILANNTKWLENQLSVLEENKKEEKMKLLYQVFTEYVKQVPDAEKKEDRDHDAIEDLDELQHFLDLVQCYLEKRTVAGFGAALGWLLIGGMLRKAIYSPVTAESGKQYGLKKYYESACLKMRRENEKNSERSLNTRTVVPSAVMHAGLLFTQRYKIRPATAKGIGKKYSTYIRRTDLLLQIEERMEFDENDKKYLLLTGMGGVGKSELARAYASEKLDDGTYKTVLWLTCKDKEEPELERLLKEYDAQLSRQDVLLADETVLLIIDNLNTGSDTFLDELLYETGDAHVLITTRLTHRMEEESRILPVVSEDPESFAVEVFQKNYGIPGMGNPAQRTAQLTEEETEDVKIIGACVAYNTMMMVLIASELREYKNHSIHEFAEQITKAGLRQAHLDGAEIQYSRDRNRMQGEIPDILYWIFEDLLHHDFSEMERQMLTVLKYAPAKKISLPFLCELLGDNAFQAAAYAAYQKLYRMGWVQGDISGETEGWVSIHSMIAEILDIDEANQKNSDVSQANQEKPESQNERWKKPFRKETDAGFYETLLKNWLVMDKTMQCAEQNLIGEMWQKSEFYGEKTELNLAVAAMWKLNQVESQFEKIFPQISEALLAAAYSEDGCKFLYFDLKKRTETVYLDLSRQKKENRYWKRNRVNVSHLPFRKEESISQKAELLWFICFDNSCRLDFPDTIADCPIEEIPDEFCKFHKEITELRLPAHLKKVGEGAFLGCRRWKGNLYLPEGLVRIEEYAFSACSFAGDLVIPDTMTEIGDSAFAFCDFQGRLEIGRNVTKIGQFAFHMCSGLDGTLTLPSNLEAIEECAFCDCQNLHGDLVIPNSVKRIGKSAFASCNGLDGTLTLSSNLEVIEECAFCDCQNLTGHISLPARIRRVGELAFVGCYHLQPPEEALIQKFQKDRILGENAFDTGGECFFGEEEEEETETVQGSFHEGCYKEPYKVHMMAPTEETLIIGNRVIAKRVPAKTDEAEMVMDAKIYFEREDAETFSGGELQIPQNITHIRAHACDSGDYNGELVLPQTVIEIGEKAFFECRGFTGELKLPDTIQYIGEMAFAMCSGFTGTLVIPESCESIGWGAFWGCRFDKIVIRNPEMELDGLSLDGLQAMIVGKKDSTAQKFAKEQNRIFLLLEK